MKKLISLILFLATATVSFAQYPLPETQVLGNLYVPNDSVGIGTSSPTDLLDVDGTVEIREDSTRLKVGTFSSILGGFPNVADGFTARRYSPSTYTYDISANRIASTGIYIASVTAIDSVSGAYRGVQAKSDESSVRFGNIFTASYNWVRSDASGVDVQLADSDSAEFYITDAEGDNSFIVDQTDSLVKVLNPYAFVMPKFSAAEASNLTAENGMVVYVTDTDATFTSVGFWGYVGGTWEKLD